MRFVYTSSSAGGGPVVLFQLCLQTALDVLETFQQQGIEDAALAAQYHLHGLFVGEGFFVAALTGQRVVDVGQRDQLRPDGDVVACQAVRIAPAIPPLVVPAGDAAGRLQKRFGLLTSREVSNVFENSDFVYMLNQAQGDREILAKQLNISQQQMTYVTHSDAGEGLIFYGNVILPFIDRFPQDTELYRVMTTKPGEVSA